MLGVGIRVVVGDQTGYAFTEELGIDSMLAAARTAAGIARGRARVAPQNLTPQKRRGRGYYDGRYDWGAVGVGDVIPLLEKLNGASHRADGRVERVTVGFAGGQNHVLVVDSDGR